MDLAPTASLVPTALSGTADWVGKTQFGSSPLPIAS